MQIAVMLASVIVWMILSSAFKDQIVRPLQTLSNVVAALREDDYSFRARGARRDDALGELALEINSLASMLQTQRVSAIEAEELLRRVVESMATPVLTFDPGAILRLMNPAAVKLLRVTAKDAVGRSAEALGLLEIFNARDEEVIPFSEVTGSPHRLLSRWMVRRTTFRQRGIPHTLLLLSDVSSALREEESQAWQRLIRVLGHEINNSLAPIKSIAGSLRSRLQRDVDQYQAGTDFERGLIVIESRADSLNRFVQAYRQLAQLPRPSIRSVALAPLIERVVSLETRIPIELAPGPNVDCGLDPDQIEQLMINLIKNAVEAAMTATEVASALTPPADCATPHVQVRWSTSASDVTISITDNGPGLTNQSNLFVPFYTTKENGSGVGLVLARQIAEAHGGTVTLSNRPDLPGCEAVVRLPLRPPAAR
ncbi:MAG TPA: ATP-binding protein [Acidisarcina sp.]